MIILGEQSIHVAWLMRTIVGHIQSQEIGGDKIKRRHGDFDTMMMVVAMGVAAVVVMGVVMGVVAVVKLI